MFVIGVVGGIASGKSTVSETLCELGADVLDADREGHAVLLDPDVESAVRQRWGEAVFRDGRIDRAAVARIVFSSPNADDERAFLERLTHPRIANRLSQRLDEARQRGVRAVVLDAAVMLKTGWDRFCDRVVFVDAPVEQRRARALLRGWSAAEFADREAAQEPVEEKRRRADVVIDNSRTLDETRNQVRCLFAGVLSGAESAA